MNELSGQKILPAQDYTDRWWESPLNLFNASEEAQMVCRADGIALHINAKAARQFKLRSELEEGGFSIFKIISPPANRKLGRLFQNHRPHAEKLHSVVVMLDNSPHSMMDLEVVSLDGQFNLVTFKDSGRRLRLEPHIQQLITAIDATPDVFFVTDADLRITFVNPAFQSVTGYSLEEVLGRTDDFLRAPFEKEKITTYHELVSQGREWISEFVNLRRDGKTYQVESTASPIFDFAGRFKGYVVCERDITVRTHLQDALRTERDFVQSILQSLDGAIYSLDCDFRLTHANDGWRHLPAEHGGIRLNGVPEIGHALLDYVPDAARRAELQALFQEVIRGSKAQDNHFHAPDGRYWLLKISPWINRAQMRGLICNIVDETQHFELQNQLFQSQKMEIIGTLAAGVAHDFNNLLQVIRGYTSLVLMQTAAGSPLRRGLEQVDLAAIRAAEITKQLLSFSRVSDEKRIVLDFNKIIKEANQLGRRTLRNNVVVELNPAPHPVLVKLDPTKASQALLNLCVNALDAMPGGGHLTLANSMVEPSADQLARHHLPAGVTYARCSVTDTGCGIPPQVLLRIFEPFYTTKEKNKGTGLGLAIVHRIVAEAGGFIEVESVIKQGTTFHLYLPIVQEQPEPVAMPEPAPLAQGRGRVLVVDDVDLLRDFTRKFLQAMGLNVLVASSGQQAIQVLEKSAEPVDLVFTDYNMPGMTGLELIEEVTKRWPQTKFILVSGFLNDAAYARTEQCHISILAKPYDMQDASQIILEKLAEKATGAADAAGAAELEKPSGL
jgi:PAS domain S-box-containing protein